MRCEDALRHTCAGGCHLPSLLLAWREIDEVDPPWIRGHIHSGQHYGQIEPPRPRTAGVNVNDALPVGPRGLVRMPAHHHGKARSRGFEVERLQIMQDVD